jgi:hypothetical protein
MLGLACLEMQACARVERRPAAEEASTTRYALPAAETSRFRPLDIHRGYMADFTDMTFEAVSFVLTRTDVPNDITQLSASQRTQLISISSRSQRSVTIEDLLNQLGAQISAKWVVIDGTVVWSPKSNE